MDTTLTIILTVLAVIVLPALLGYWDIVAGAVAGFATLYYLWHRDQAGGQSHPL